MPTNYPTSIDSYSARTNNVDTINAGDINDARDAIVAIETKLGTSTQQISAPRGVNVPRSTGTAVFALDSSNGGTLSINADATANPFGNANNFSGLMLIQDLNNAETALFLTAAGSNILVSSVGTTFSNTINTANKTNVYISSGAVTIQNKQTTRSYSITAIRILSFNT